MAESFNPWALTPPVFKVEERIFTDRHHPGVSFALRFKEPDSATTLRIPEIAEEWKRTFVRSGAGIAVDGREDAVLVDEDACDALAMLAGLDADDHSLSWWVGIYLLMPDAFRSITHWAAQLLGGDTGTPRGNDKAASG